MKVSLHKVQKALGRVLPKFPVAFAYVFGSQASGKTYKESDLDIAIGFTPDIEPDKAEDLLLDMLIAINRALPIPTKMLDLKNFARLPLPVRFRAIQGQLVYCKDVATHRNRVVKTVREYHDEESFFQKAALAFFKRNAAST